MRLTTNVPKLAPPTEHQLAALKERLRQCLFIEHAAALAGIPKRVLTEWILRGRAGDPQFVPFVEMLDQQLAELSDDILTPIVEAAKHGSVKASMWLYDHRIRPHEERALKRQFDMEDRIAEAQRTVQADVVQSDGDALAAELMGQLTAGPAEKH